MLEAERRRVRLETKALHERMRAIQHVQPPSLQPDTLGSRESLIHALSSE